MIAMITTPTIIGGYFYALVQLIKTKNLFLGMAGQVMWIVFTGRSFLIVGVFLAKLPVAVPKSQAKTSSLIIFCYDSGS